MIEISDVSVPGTIYPRDTGKVLKAMSIRVKLISILVSLFIFIVALVGFNFHTFDELKGDSPMVNASGSLRMKAYQLSWLSARLVSADDAESGTIRKNIGEFIAQYDAILKGLDAGDPALNLTKTEDPAARAQLDALRPRWEAYKAQVNAVVAADAPDARAAADAKVAASVTDYVAAVNGLVSAYDAASQEKIAASKTVQEIIILLALVIVGGAFFIIFTQILRPLAMLTHSFADIAEGDADLTRQIHAERDDEIGRIVAYFNKFVAHLQTIMRGAQSAAAEVSALSSDLSQASGESSRAVDHVAHLITDMAGEANAQNTDMQSLAERVTAIAGNMTEMQSYAGHSAQLSGDSKDSADAGRTNVAGVSAQTDRLRGIVDEMNANVQSLTQYSEDINQIVDIIKELSGQTNLLALNAAIEAARAGETGRGFAVVAEEVRKLAENSGNAADEVTKKIAGIRGQVTQTRTANDTLVRELDEIVSVIGDLTGTLDTIFESSKKSADAVSEISALSESTAARTQEMETTAQGVAKSAAQIAGLSEDSAAAIEEQTASIESFTTAAENLSRLAANLEGLVGKFKV